MIISNYWLIFLKKNAIKTESIDEVNKEFAKLKIEDAERILEIFNECGVIGISGYIEDEKEFEELKKEYAHETANQEEDQSASVEDTVD
ncbi:Cdc37 C terminal domain family protein [Candida albicans]|uniref:Cdc37 C terminal domain family protein n=1 Tax=Candida albicans TaxID=5476 RepID=A0A8H6C1H0_CANAX|nr:Cdc37 C terminal domain family protein [Candida albicans]